MTITTYDGSEKQITGQPRALKLRHDVRKKFDQLRDEYPYKSFAQLCEETGQEFMIGGFRVRRILVEDYGYKK